MEEIKIVATDLDGTLLNSQLQISDKNKAVLRSLKENGIPLVLCTGRPFSGMKHLVDELDLHDSDYSITYNGSLVQTCDGRQILHQAQLSPKSFLALSQFFEQFEVGVHAMTMTKMYTYNQSVHELTQRESHLGNLPLTVLPNHERIEEPIVKIMAVGTADKLDRAIPYFHQRYGKQFSINKSEPFYLEIMQAGDNKAKALNLLLKRLGLASNQLMAFGNNQNDQAMLEMAGVGVSVANGVDSLKAVANYITDSNDQDGVGRFIENYFMF